MKIIVKICFTIFLSVIFCACSRSPQEIWSPNNENRLVAYSQNGFVRLELYSIKGELLFSEKTTASAYQKWNVRWIDNNNFILKSSDIGNFCYTNEHGKWRKVRENFIYSPTKKFIVSIEKQTNSMIFDIEILKPERLHYPESFDVLYKGQVNIDNDNIRAVVLWDGDNKVLIKGINSSYILEKDSNDSWTLH